VIKVLKVLLIASAVVFFAAFVAMLCFNTPAGAGDGKSSFTVGEGESSLDIARKLEERNFIRSSTYFIAVSYFSHYLHNFKAGRFEISPAMTTQQIAQILGATEPLQKVFRITIPEGYTAAEIALKYDGQGLCPAGKFMEIVRDPAGMGIDTRGYELPGLEGFLFPETYFFDDRSTCKDMAQRMADQFFNVFGRAKIERAKEMGLSLVEAVTLASLVEEAKVERERPVIAGVLLNRLRKNIKLQCDATVQYALPHRKERLFYKDLEVDSPYNTYKYNGLPPGPICNPGRTSLAAAVNPEKSDYFYYVAKGDGSHIFSRGEEEHGRAIQIIRRGRAR
jgi:UPF0755 protein